MTELPSLPPIDLPEGSVWPDPEGWRWLREARSAAASLHEPTSPFDGSGKRNTFVFRAGAWCLKTSTDRAYDSRASAEVALGVLARRKLALGAWTLPSTALLVHEAEGRHWLWTLSPWVKTLRTTQEEHFARRDQAALGASLEVFASAVTGAIALALRQGICLDLHPNNFALWDGKLRYVDDDIFPSSRLPAVGHAILRRVIEFADAPEAIERYLSRLEEEFRRSLRPDEILRSGLVEAIATFPRSPAVAQDAIARLTAELTRKRS